MSPRYALRKIAYSRHNQAKTQLEVSGWMHRGDGYPADAIRILLGTRRIDCHKTVRDDLGEQIAAGVPIKDAHIGFNAKFATKPGLKLLRLEFLAKDGKWRTFARRVIRVPAIKTMSPPSPTTTAIKPKSSSKPVPRHFSSGKKKAPISIVMPTYNRADTLAEVVRATHRLCAGYEVEWVIVNDGSSDHTPAVLDALAREIPTLRHETIRNGGPGNARNVGAALARHDVILFMGDDILPDDEEFLRPHAELHAEHETTALAVLGKVVWPESGRMSVSPVMRHIQGKGGEQFGYADFTPHMILDWRFFYTCNVSMKRRAVDDWTTQGFSDRFRFASFEDGELAYRLSKRPEGFRIFYAPASQGRHLHAYSVAGFLRRQEYAGAMAATFLELHPETLPLLGISEIREILNSDASGRPDSHAADYLCLLEGIKAWARILEHEGRLGNEAWHEELLFAVFELSYLQGYVVCAARARSDHAAAYAAILRRAKMRIGRIMESEMTADARFKSAILGIR